MKKLSAVLCVSIVAVTLMLSCKTAVGDSNPNVVKATLNGLEITLDGQTGSILSLDYPGLNKILDANQTFFGRNF